MVTFKCVYNNDSAFNIGDYTNHYKFHIDSSIENIDLNLKSIPKCLEAGIGGQATEEESQDDFISFRLDFKASKRTINKTIELFSTEENKKIYLKFWSDSNDQYINLEAGNEFETLQDTKDRHVIYRKEDGLQIALHGQNSLGEGENFMTGVYISVRNNSHWMERLAKKHPERQLKDIFIPGTHDSATYMIEWTRSLARVEVMEKDAPEVAIAYDTGLGGVPGTELVARKAIAALAKAQDTSIFVQLVDGVRFFDLRPCMNDDGEFWISHSLYSIPLNEVLEDVKRFLEKNKGELVILDLRYIWGLSVDRESRTKQLCNQIEDQLGKSLISVDNLGKLKLTDFLNRDQGSVVLLWNFDDKGRVYKNSIEPKKFGLLDTRNWASIIGEGDEYDTSEKLIEQIDKTLIKDRDKKKPCLVKCEIDADIMKRITTGKSLKGVAFQSNPEMLKKIKNNWGNSRQKGGHIYTFDFYNNCELSNTIVQLNFSDGE